MRAPDVRPTGQERTFGYDELIVTKTDPKGIITYVNDVFEEVSRFSSAESIGQPHNIIRHPDMPRCVFKYLWDTIEAGREVFAYVNNLAKDGAHYWVLAHVTPTFDASGAIVSYHSNRRSPSPTAIKAIEPIYAALLQEERKHSGRVAQADAGLTTLVEVLNEQQKTYDEFVWNLINTTRHDEVSA